MSVPQRERLMYFEVQCEWEPDVWLNATGRYHRTLREARAALADRRKSDTWLIEGTNGRMQAVPRDIPVRILRKTTTTIVTEISR